MKSESGSAKSKHRPARSVLHDLELEGIAIELQSTIHIMHIEYEHRVTRLHGSDIWVIGCGAGGT